MQDTIPARDLQSGDRIRLAPGLWRTVSHMVNTGLVNRHDAPIYAVYFAEGATPEWGRANTWATTSIVTVARGV